MTKILTIELVDDLLLKYVKNKSVPDSPGRFYSVPHGTINILLTGIGPWEVS